MINKKIYNSKHIKILKKREYNHSIRVAEYAYEFGKVLKFNIKKLNQLYDLAFFHDIGKENIDDNILNKKEKLTSKEREILKQHPIFSEKFLLNNKILEEFAYIVRAHHENWDGTGYPDNLKGENIPYFSRIISIVDTYDALTSVRPYREKVYTKNKALKIIIDQAYKKYDPNLVMAFVKNNSKIVQIHKLEKRVIR